MARRKKAAALDVPATADEARLLIEEYVANERILLKARLTTVMFIDALKSELAEQSAPLVIANQARFDAIKAWWEAGGKEVAGKARSAEVGGAKLGFRLTPHALKLKRGITAESVIAWAKSWLDPRGKDFLRTKEELDKAAIIKAAQADTDLAPILKEQGVTISQTDEFFIDTGFDEDAIKKEVAASCE